MFMMQESQKSDFEKEANCDDRMSCFWAWEDWQMIGTRSGDAQESIGGFEIL